MLKRGDAILMPKKYADATPHVWILLTDPAEDQAAIVNVTTLRNHPDQTVILKVGDHPYITHDSIIFYADARIVPVTPIEEGLKMNTPIFRKLESCSTELIKRISEGVFASDFTPNKVIDYCAKQWGTEKPSQS